jgi:hypothetical protein
LAVCPPCPARFARQRLQGQWEAYQVRTLDNTVWLVGSDFRGTAFAAYTLSERLGIDPLYLWTGYTPAKHPTLILRQTEFIADPPTFKYRGFFHDDEDILPRPFDENGYPLPEAEEFTPGFRGRPSTLAFAAMKHARDLVRSAIGSPEERSGAVAGPDVHDRTLLDEGANGLEIASLHGFRQCAVTCTDDDATITAVATKHATAGAELESSKALPIDDRDPTHRSCGTDRGPSTVYADSGQRADGNAAKAFRETEEGYRRKAKKARKDGNAV